MLILAVIILILIIGSSFIGYDDKRSSYEEFCNTECWSRRKPCCRRA